MGCHVEELPGGMGTGRGAKLEPQAPQGLPFKEENAEGPGQEPGKLQHSGQPVAQSPKRYPDHLANAGVPRWGSPGVREPGFRMEVEPEGFCCAKCQYFRSVWTNPSCT